MQKKTLLVTSLLLSTVVLAGCFGTKTPEETAEFSHASCNDYVKLMRCVAEKQGGQEAFDAVEQAINAWKSIPESELIATCDMAMEVAAANAAAYAQLGCEVPASLVAPTQEVVEDVMVDEVATDDIMTDEDMNEEAMVDEVATVEVAEVVSEVTNEVVAQ